MYGLADFGIIVVDSFLFTDRRETRLDVLFNNAYDPSLLLQHARLIARH